MPFISIRIISSEVETLPISFISAGDDQNILCATIVQLEGYVGAIAGTYTFEWEQLSGTPVVLENEDTLSPWFINPNTGDFSFRLWVNRNTPLEQFSDVEIFRNPAAILTNQITREPFFRFPTILSGASVSSEQDLLIQSRSSPSIFSDQIGTVLPIARQPEEYAILWEHPIPSNPNKVLLGVEVERWDAGWVSEAFRPLNKKHYNIVPGETYRLVTVWFNMETSSVIRETDKRIYVAGGGRPGFPEIGITSPLTNTASRYSINNLELYLEQRSLRTSGTDRHNNTVSETIGDFNQAVVHRARGVPIFQTEDKAINFINEYIGSDSSNTSITRAGGISIG